MNRLTWLQRLPKSEHHLHIEGTIPWSMVYATAGEPLPLEPHWFDPAFQFDDFADFQLAMSHGIQRVITAPDAYYRIAQHHFEQLVAQNVRYVETSFHVALPFRRGYAFQEVLNAILAASPPTLTVRVFAAFQRDVVFPDEVIQDVLSLSHLAGIDIHGDERNGSVDPYIEVFEEARRRELRTKAHAGELLDASAVTTVLDKLQPQRIQHGVASASAPLVVERLAREGIILDLCPTSNVKLRVVPDLTSYPIRTFLDKGVRVTVNTDDPSVFDCTLTGEWLALLENQLLTLREIADIQREAFRSTYISPTVYRALENEIDELLELLDEDAMSL